MGGSPHGGLIDQVLPLPVILHLREVGGEHGIEGEDLLLDGAAIGHLQNKTSPDMRHPYTTPFQTPEHLCTPFLIDKIFFIYFQYCIFAGFLYYFYFKYFSLTGFSFTVFCFTILFLLFFFTIFGVTTFIFNISLFLVLLFLVLPLLNISLV